MKLRLYLCSIRNKTTCLTNKKNYHEKKEWIERETRTILDSVKQNLTNIK